MEDGTARVSEEIALVAPEEPKATIGSEPLEEWMASLLSAVSDASRSAKLFPSATEHSQLLAIPGYRARASAIKSRIVSLLAPVLSESVADAEKVLESATATEDVRKGCAALDAEITTRVDTLLESVDKLTDVDSGAPRLVVSKAVHSSRREGLPDVQMFYGRNIARPQDTFPDRVDNFTREPWRPKFLTEKPNAMVPLDVIVDGYERSLKEFTAADSSAAETVPDEIASHVQGLGIVKGNGSSDARKPPEFPHPYAKEIASVEYQPWQFEASETKYGDLASTPLTWVDTPEKLVEMSKKLEAAREFAIDLEAHDLRSYTGFTCLMQISTRTEDFVVDTLTLRKELVMLNSSFTDPRILKVVHGCDWDVLWLQRDHNLYLVNAFDTGQAARVLEFPSFGLKYLLQLYCNVEADKKYQLADWRIRPLPEEMYKYAREDTHYLLYIYDRLRTELLARANGAPDLVTAVLNRTRDITLKTHRNPPRPDADTAARFVLQARASLTPSQQEVVRELFFWRDFTARTADESTRYVLPNHMIIAISQTLPKTIPQLLACCSPVPPLVRTNAAVILDIVKKTMSTAFPSSSAVTVIKEARKMAEKPTHVVFNDDTTMEVDEPRPQQEQPEQQQEGKNREDGEVKDGEIEEVMPETRNATTTMAEATGGSSLFGGGGSDDEDEEDADAKEAAKRIALAMQSTKVIAVPQPSNPDAEDPKTAPAPEKEPEPETVKTSAPEEPKSPKEKRDREEDTAAAENRDHDSSSDAEVIDEKPAAASTAPKKAGQQKKRPKAKKQKSNPESAEAKKFTPFNYSAMAKPSKAFATGAMPEKETKADKKKPKRGQSPQLFTIEQPQFAGSAHPALSRNLVNANKTATFGGKK